MTFESKLRPPIEIKPSPRATFLINRSARKFLDIRLKYRGGQFIFRRMLNSKSIVISNKGIMKTGIILDTPYSNGLLAKAIENGYAKITSPSDYINNVLSKARNPKVGRKALEMLLIYDKVYVTSWFDNIEYEQLNTLDILEVLDNNWTQTTVEEDYAKSIKGLLLADLKRRRLKISPEQFDKILPDVNAIYFGKIMDISAKMGSVLDEIFDLKETQNQVKDENLVFSEMFKTERNIFLKYSDEDIELGQHIQDSHYHMRNLLEASVQLDIPVYSNIKNTPKLPSNHIGTKLFDPNVRIALSIFMKETLYIPNVQSIEQVLQLRNDTRIIYFREKILEWSKKLRNGQLGTEESIRKEIRDANKAIKDIGLYSKVGMWVTFLSVPLGVAELLLGLPISLITATPIGIGLSVASKLKERKHNWLLFGS